MNDSQEKTSLPKATWIPAAAALAILTGVSNAATLLPSWTGDANTSRNGYNFTTNSATPVPTVSTGGYGQPSASIVAPGPQATGWQTPGGSFSGIAKDGAWDIGTGSITVDVPFAAAVAGPGTYYQVDFYVSTVNYVGLSGAPTLSVYNAVPSDVSILGATMSDETLQSDPPFGSWTSRVWTGTVSNVTDNSLTFVINGYTPFGSLVDGLEISTRFTLVPEPSVTLLIAGVGMLALRRRRSA